MALACGCAQLAPPAQQPARSDALAYWARAVGADASKRGALIADAQRAKASWKLAMLRSLPGSQSRDAATSRAELRSLLRQGLPEDEAALTRLRIAELDQMGTCEADVDDLRDRLGRIVDIERQIEYGR